MHRIIRDVPPLLAGLLLFTGCALGPAEDEEELEPSGASADIAPSCAGDASSTGRVRGEVKQLQAVGDSILAHNKEQMASIADVVAGELGVPLRHNAVGGALLGGADGIPTLYEPGVSTHVLVNGGGNDFSAGCEGAVLDGIVSADLTRGLMVDLLDQIGADGAQSVIVSYYIPQDGETGCDLFPELLRRYRALGETREDVMYVCSLETITPSDPELYDDPVHPSPAGSAAVGRLVADLLRE